MSLLEVRKYPDPVLNTRAEPISEVTSEIKTLIEDMFETMYRNRGIGLAANQVGVAKRVIVLDIPEEDEEGDQRYEGRERKPIALINPEIVEERGSIKYEEGCLSVPGINAGVQRFASVRLKALDGDGRPVEISAEGLLAIALQHEIDHIDGILFIERLSWLKRDYIKRKLKKTHEEAPEGNFL